MSQSSSRSFGHRRCSSTPPHNPRLGRKTSSFLSMACEIFAPAGTHTECKDPAASGQGRPEIHYTYSFRRAEHTKSWVMPPPYEPLYPTQNNDISYTFSPTRRRSGELSPTLTTQGTPGACPPLFGTQSRRRSNSTPVSPVVSPLSSTASPMAYLPYRPALSAVSQHQNDQTPGLELPSPFSSPFFYWSGESRQQVTENEAARQDKLDDLSLMSPYGSPNFYWNGVSTQEEEEESSIDRAKRTLDRPGLHKFRSPRSTAVKHASKSDCLVWDELRGAYVRRS